MRKQNSTTMNHKYAVAAYLFRVSGGRNKKNKLPEKYL